MSGLFELFDLHGLTLSNRIIMAPMTRSRATAEYVPSALMPEYYRQRAGAGLIITEATAISKQGCGYPNIPGIWNDAQTQAWKGVVDAVHQVGGKIFIQLVHTGRIAHRSLTSEQPVSSSEKAPDGQVMAADYSMQPYETPRALALDELPGIIEQFRNAAANAKIAGFDGIEIHAANGYLLDQFLRDGVNQRRDNYGGSLENRARLLLEVTQATIEAFGKHRVGVRLSPYNAFNSMSDSNPMKTFTKAAALLNALPLAYLHMMEPYGEHMLAGDSSLPRITEKVRTIYNGVLVVNGGLSKELGEKLLQEHVADLFCYGMPYIANPDLVNRFQKNIPLAQVDQATIYGGDAKGYTDYPTAA